MRMNHKQAVGFREWLASCALSQEEEEWFMDLDKESLEELARALEAEGYPIDENGYLIIQGDDFGFWEAFEDAIQRIGQKPT
jgi:hypothetical protein